MKYRLLAPGPTPVPDRVLKEMCRTIIHHRTEMFEGIFASCKEGLAWLLGTETPPLVLASSGTGAFEASIQNFFKKGDAVLCITGGKFGDNWLKLCQSFHLDAIEVAVAWGEAVDPQVVKKHLDARHDIKGVVVVASETSTGVRQPYEHIAQMVKERHDCLLVVDGVTALGVWDISPERDHIDILVGGCQKGLMLPPGLGFVWASQKAWAAQKTSDLPKFYFDLAKERKAQAKNQTGHTPAISLIMGLQEAMTMMKEEGRDAIFSRHERLGRATRAAMQALNLRLFAKSPSDAITSVYTPDNLAPDAVYKGLMRMANFTIAGGQDQLSGKIFRIGHMGYVDEIDLLGVFGALEIVLQKLGYEKFAHGASIKASSSILQEGF